MECSYCIPLTNCFHPKPDITVTQRSFFKKTFDKISSSEGQGISIFQKPLKQFKYIALVDNHCLKPSHFSSIPWDKCRINCLLGHVHWSSHRPSEQTIEIGQRLSLIYQLVLLECPRSWEERGISTSDQQSFINLRRKYEKYSKEGDDPFIPYAVTKILGRADKRSRTPASPAFLQKMTPGNKLVLLLGSLENGN